MGEVRPGDDLAGRITAAIDACAGPELQDGDVVVVTSKVVSKAEGQLMPAGSRPRGDTRGGGRGQVGA